MFAHDPCPRSDVFRHEEGLFQRPMPHGVVSLAPLKASPAATGLCGLANADGGVTAYLERPVHRSRPNERFLQSTIRSVAGCERRSPLSTMAAGIEELQKCHEPSPNDIEACIISCIAVQLLYPLAMKSARPTGRLCGFPTNCAHSFRLEPRHSEQRLAFLGTERLV